MKLRLCVLGPMLGGNTGHVVSQGELLVNQFKRENYETYMFSSVTNRYLRLADMIRGLWGTRNQTDIVLLETFSGKAFVTADILTFFAKKLNKKLIMHLHGGALPEFIAKYPKWAIKVLKRADALVTPSAYLKRTVNELGLQAVVIPNFVEIKDYSYRHRAAVRPQLIWMRAFHPIYNPQMAIRVLAKVKKKYPEAQLVMGGQDKGLRADTEKYAEQMGVKASIRSVGFLEMPDKVREFDQADIYLNTNHMDNTPVSVIEACAFGLPVIATDVGGIADLLENKKTGLLVTDNDTEAMAKAVFQLIENPSLAAQLSSAGRQLAETFSWENILPRWEQLFEELGSLKK